MLRPQRLLKDIEGTLVERLGVGVFALVFVEQREVVDVASHIGMVRPEGLLRACERAVIERLGVGVFALTIVERR
jgi:hypothetical protein